MKNILHNTLKTSILLLILCFYGNLIGQIVKSPNHKIAVIVHELSDCKKGDYYYSIWVNNKILVTDSRLGLVSSTRDLNSHFTISSISYQHHDSVWQQPWGENKQIRNAYNEMQIIMTNNDSIQLELTFRVFNDGVGFRYAYSNNHSDEEILITDELTEFNFAEEALSWSIPANFETYELIYRTLPLSQIENANTPITFRTKRGLYASIHEAALVDFPEMTLERTSPLHFKSQLACWPDGVKAHVRMPFKTPWRTIQIGQRAVDLINSNLILNLNEPCQLQGDLSWIKPMKYIGIWWGMHLGIASWSMDERHGATTANAIRYIDFAANNNIQGVLFEGWNEGWETWGSRQSFDFTQPYADFDIDSITRHAQRRGVQLIGHHETGGNVYNYERQLDKSYQWYADYGVHYVKTGYAGGFPDGHSHHGQFAVNHHQKVVETAAQYHTCLDVHEPVKATGLRRTFPNLMTREGARGMEWNAWSSGNDAAHTTILPFTRLLAGPMDYTPGVFDILYEGTRNSPLFQKWNDQDQGNSRVHTTLARQMANWIILYSPLQMACDLIENYEQNPAFDFFRQLNIDFDESEALQGEPGEFIVIRRRSGETHYLSAGTNEEGRSVKVKLHFLNPKQVYTAELWTDAPDTHWESNPTAYQHQLTTVKKGQTLRLTLAPGGGAAIVIKPKIEQH